jgi:outer membrane assembly lipoprotein YfiO
MDEKTVSMVMRIVSGFVLAAAAAALLSVGGCAGGMPSVPSAPDAVLEKAQSYFERGKYYQARGLYKAFLERYPGNDKSDVAQFYVAECYFADDEYPLASVEYRVLASNYGYSEYVDDAFYKMALCSAREAPRSDRDQTKSLEALSLFDQFFRTFPNSPLVAEATVQENEVRKKLAKKDFENGYFYYRHKRFEPASIYFNKVIDNYPGNEHWLKALFYQAKILIAEGDTNTARDLLDKVMEYPKDSDVKREAGEVLGTMKEE